MEKAREKVLGNEVTGLAGQNFVGLCNSMWRVSFIIWAPESLWGF